MGVASRLTRTKKGTMRLSDSTQACTRNAISKRMSVFAGALLAAALLQHGTVRADDPINIALAKGTLAESIEQSINIALAKRIAKEKENGTEHPALEHIQWDSSAWDRVEISRDQSNSVAVHANLIYQDELLPEPDVDLDFKLWFSCDFLQPNLAITVSEFTIEVDYSAVIDVLTGGVSLVLTSAADALVDSKGEIASQVSAGASSSISLGDIPYCPHFNVTDGADVVIYFDTGTECTQSGVVSRRACPKYQEGDGITEYCINGYRETTRQCGAAERGGITP